MFSIQLSLALAALCLGCVNAVDWNAVIRRCLALSGYSFKEACADMGISEPQFSAQLSGEGHLSLKRLGRLHPRFHRWFAVEIARCVGMPEELQHARRLQQAVGFTNEERMSA